MRLQPGAAPEVTIASSFRPAGSPTSFWGRPARVQPSSRPTGSVNASGEREQLSVPDGEVSSRTAEASRFHGSIPPPHQGRAGRSIRRPVRITSGEYSRCCQTRYVSARQRDQVGAPGGSPWPTRRSPAGSRQPRPPRKVQLNRLGPLDPVAVARHLPPRPAPTPPAARAPLGNSLDSGDEDVTMPPPRASQVSSPRESDRRPGQAGTLTSHRPNRGISATSVIKFTMRIKGKACQVRGFKRASRRGLNRRGVRGSLWPPWWAGRRDGRWPCP